MVTKQARTVPFKVTITPQLHDELRQVAAALGQAPATVASLAIGQYVAQQVRSLGAMQTAVDALATRLEPHLKDEFQRQMTLAEASSAKPPARKPARKASR